jgi:hypothetical protein
MVRRLGTRMFALTALFGSAGAVVELVHRTLHLHW